MQVNIRTSKIELTTELKNFIEERIKKLENFLGEKILRATVEVEKMSKHKKGPFFSVNCQVVFPGISIRVESLQENLETAILEIEKKLERKLKEFKGKSVSKFKRGARRAKRELLISELAKKKEGKRVLREGL